MNWTASDMDIVLSILQRGPMFIGAFNDGEYAAACHLIKQGKARRVYQGAGGFLGLAKIQLLESQT